MAVVGALVVSVLGTLAVMVAVVIGGLAFFWPSSPSEDEPVPEDVRDGQTSRDDDVPQSFLGESPELGVSIAPAGNLILVDTTCSGLGEMAIVNLTAEDEILSSWLLEVPTTSRTVELIPTEATMLTDDVGDFYQLVESFPEGTLFEVGAFFRFPSLEFLLSDLTPEVVLTADGPQPARLFDQPCVRGGNADGWGVHLLESGLVEVVSLDCDGVLEGAFSITVDGVPRAAWHSRIMAEILDRTERGKGQFDLELQNADRVLLDPATDAKPDPGDQVGLSLKDVAPQSVIRVEQVLGGHVLARRLDLSPEVVVNASEVVPLAEVGANC